MPTLRVYNAGTGTWDLVGTQGAQGPQGAQGSIGVTGAAGLPSRIVPITAANAGTYAPAVGDLVQVDASAGNVAISTPSNNPNTGLFWSVKKMDSSTNTVTVTPAAGGHIDGDPTGIQIVSPLTGATIEGVGGTDWIIAAVMTAQQGAQGPQGSGIVPITQKRGPSQFGLLWQSLSFGGNVAGAYAPGAAAGSTPEGYGNVIYYGQDGAAPNSWGIMSVEGHFSGTYTFALYTMKTNNSGFVKLEYSTDGGVTWTTIDAGYDNYGASPSVVLNKTYPGLVIPDTTDLRLRVSNPGTKNAASSGYFWVVQEYELVRTGA